MRYNVELPGHVIRIREYSMQQAADQLLRIRVNNKLGRASYDECVSDVSAFTCQELGCDSKWCLKSSSSSFSPAVTVSASRAKPCATCGKKGRR